MKLYSAEVALSHIVKKEWVLSKKSNIIVCIFSLW